jgi:hypothetical protein
MLLLGIAVAAILIGALKLVTEQVQAPAGSSYSTQSDGALALYTWLGDVGGQAQRLTEAAVDPAVGTVLVLQPPSIVDQSTQAALRGVADRGGTIVLAGDSVQWLILARALGVSVEPASAPSATAMTPDGLRLPFTSRYRLRSDTAGARPLLVREDGDWVALQVPYRQGNLVVVASPEPFANAGLGDDATARFVFRELVSPAVTAGQPVAFDEIERSAGAGDPNTPNLDQLLFQTPAGRAVLYAALLTFVFLLLAGRRLGPPVYLRSAAEAPRTMYEHVQMLANLYRRAGQLSVVREAFSRHYRRVLGHRTLTPGRSATLAEGLARVESSRSESDLVAAVAAIEDAR